MSTYRSLGNTLGLGLLECPSTVGVIEGFNEFIEGTGLPANRIVSRAEFSTPIPIFDSADPRWAGVKPDAMWHPFFWLPAGVRDRIVVETANGPLQEPSYFWGVRLCLALAESGLYDPSEGWVDILAEHGIDVSTEQGRSRVQRWQQGEPDGMIDSIDISPLFETEVDWSEVSDTLAPILTEASWYIVADELLDRLDEMLGTESSHSAIQHAETIVSLGAIFLSQVPKAANEPVSSAEFWATTESEVEDYARVGDLERIRAFSMLNVRERLESILDQYRHTVDELQEALNEE